MASVVYTGDVREYPKSLAWLILHKRAIVEIDLYVVASRECRMEVTLECGIFSCLFADRLVCLQWLQYAQFGNFPITDHYITHFLK